MSYICDSDTYTRIHTHTPINWAIKSQTSSRENKVKVNILVRVVHILNTAYTYMHTYIGTYKHSIH